MFTYQRDIDHCELTDLVRPVTIKSVEPAQNSDFLELIKFEEVGWQCLAQKDKNNVGDVVMYIPPESVLPFELTEEAEITKLTAKGRVKAIRLRGNRSEGLILPVEMVEKYLGYIYKWEDLVDATLRGKVLANKESSYDMVRIQKIPNILNEPNIFFPGERLFVSEKIHGANLRAGVLERQAGGFRSYVGSHRMVLDWQNMGEEDKLNVFKNGLDQINVIKNDELALPVGLLFFGEAFGKKCKGGAAIQTNFGYGRKNTDVLFYTATKAGEYLLPEKFMKLCDMYDLPRVNFHEITFESIDQLRELAEQPSEFTKEHIREGIVVYSADRSGVIAKVISFKYMELQGRGKTTETH